MKTLNQVKVGETVKVTKIAGEGPIKRRIMDMGITKGVEIYVRKVAPLGDPVEITVRNYELSVRKVEPCESTLRYKVKALYLKGAFWYFAKQLRKVD